MILDLDIQRLSKLSIELCQKNLFIHNVYLSNLALPGRRSITKLDFFSQSGVNFDKKSAKLYSLYSMRANDTQVLRKSLKKIKSHPAAVGCYFQPLASVTIHLFLKDLFIFTVCVWAFVSMYVCLPPMCLASTGAKGTSIRSTGT